MVADNPRCESPVTGKLPENSQFDQTAYPFSALPTQPRYRQVPPTSVRVAFPEVAKRLGIDQAHILSQIHYWMTNPRAGYIKEDWDGQIRKWVWFTYEMLATQLPWMSAQKIGRHVRDLEDLSLMLSTNKFNTTRYNRTKWYSPDYIAIDDYIADNPYAEYAVRPQTLESSNSNIREFSNERSNKYYPQKKTTKNNNIGDDAFLKTGKEVGGTSTVTSYDVVRDECCTENWRFSLPEDAQTIADRSQDERVCEETVCEPPPKPKKLPKPKKREEVKQEAQNNPEKEDIGQALHDAGLMSQKLMSLALKYSLEAVQKTIAMLNQQGNAIKNPAGWFTKSLKEHWWKQNQQPQRRKKKTQPKSWEAEFNPWYAWAISEGIVENVNIRYLSANQFGEPYVRLAVPDRFLSIPYTVEYWRTAQKQFPMPNGASEKLYSSLPTDDPPSTAGGDCVQNRPVENDNSSTSNKFVDSSPGGVSGEREVSPDANESPNPQSSVIQNHPVESITEDSSLDSPQHSPMGVVSQNLEPDDSPTRSSSDLQNPPVEAVNENDLSGSPPDTSPEGVIRELSPGESPTSQSHLTQNHPSESISPNSLSGSPPNSSSQGDISRKVALDFTDPNWMEFPWEPKNGWQPGAERERSRRHKAEWCRNQLLRVSSDEEMHELFHQLGDYALACLEWVDRNLLTPHEVASRHARMDARRNYEQQSLLE
ncbi:hypothetical protein IQ235_03985 [Oscillatoriales cyanobacterium LEGE 11467]|uniref:Uncharacterized protein n=1 Tax=Zarconia navalis LEGE 11467 TaxID=1828826 RepID=A0A928Z638_9CYAN|nr:hypothetical protein [Zarconia navalis]MBE9039952.1 hypothetical protein [Zarconia navalis LEGE 11467]